MPFAGINYYAIIIAAIVGWFSGAVWYSLLGKIWVRAQGKTPEQFHAHRAAIKGTTAAWLPFALAFLADIVLAWVLTGIVGHLGPITIRSAVISALHVWGGFIVTTMLVNYSFAGRRYLLTAIDAGHWLVVLILMGVVIGWMGV